MGPRPQAAPKGLGSGDRIASLDSAAVIASCVVSRYVVLRPPCWSGRLSVPEPRARRSRVGVLLAPGSKVL